MASITKCPGYDCPRRESCLRYTIPATEPCHWLRLDPRDEDGVCCIFKEDKE